MKYLLNRIKSRRLFYFTIIILLYFVFLDEIANTFLISAPSKILSESSWIQEHTLVCLLLSLQIIFSSLQSGFSDYYLRRKSIIISISATLISIFLLKFALYQYIWLLFFSVIIKGVAGNTLPIAWSGISDETKNKDIRFFLALSICALAVGSWSSLIAIPYLPSKLMYKMILAALIIGILVVIFCYFDSEDTPHNPDKSLKNKDILEQEKIKKMSFLRLLKKECFGIYRLGKKALNFLALNAFLFSEISFYQILFRVEALNTYQCFIRVPLAIGIGYTIGTIILKFIKAIDRVVSALGITISIIAILSANIFFLFGNTNQIIFTILFALYSFGYALFTPSLFSLIMVKEALHDRGKGYGLIESTDSLAALITFILVFKTKNISCVQSLNTSSILMLISVIIFIFVFKKDKNHIM